MSKKRRIYRNITGSRGIIKKYSIFNYVIALLVIIMTVFGGVFIKLGIDTRKNTTPLYNFEMKKSSNYQVLLKPNNFYMTEILPSGRYYASKSINSFLIDFGYNFNTNKNTNVDYNYNITADLVGEAKTEDNQNKEVWSRTFNLIDNNNSSQNDIKEFSISQNVNIDYENYVNLVRSYEQTYGLSVTAILKVRLNVYMNVYNFDLDNQVIEDYIELDIPINSTITEVNENYETATAKSITTSTTKINMSEFIYYVLATLLLLSAFFISIITLVKKHINKTADDVYEHNINKILKNYGDLIVTVKNQPELNDLEIMNVAQIEDLIDVAEQNSCNIIHYELFNKHISNLYVFVGNYAFIYIVTGDEDV